MTTNEVREVLKASPFTPFSLRLVDGSTVRIDHPEFALLPPGRRAIAIFPKDEGSGGLRYFDVGLVSAWNWTSRSRPARSGTPQKRPSERARGPGSRILGAG